MPEAIVRNATTTFHLIEGSQLDDLDNLTVNQKPILIVRGGSSQLLVGRVFREFSHRLDKAGQPFRLSRKLKSIVHTDPYGHPVKVSGPQMEEYLDSFFQYVELVHTAPPRTIGSPPITGGNQKYLRLLEKLPQFVGALLAQGRFLQPEMLTEMEFID
jgi:hypothetical protein